MDDGAYHFFIDNSEHEHGSYDSKILDVVTVILEEFFSQEPTVMLYICDSTDHKSGQCINLNRHDMSELQDMLANTLKMERGKKSDKKWRDTHTFKAEQKTLRAKEVAEYTERKKVKSKQLVLSLNICGTLLYSVSVNWLQR